MSYCAFTSIFRKLQSTVGYKPLTLISYARKFTYSPRLKLKGKSIVKELYYTAVPTGRLPFDLPTHTFIAEAEKRVADISHKQHLALYLFKKRLLRVLHSKVVNYP
jgi:hypothetical protein